MNPSEDDAETIAGGKKRGDWQVKQLVHTGVVQDDRVRSSQRDTEATRSGGQQEHKPITVGIVEPIDGALPLGGVHISIKALIGIAPIRMAMSREHMSEQRTTAMAAAPANTHLNRRKSSRISSRVVNCEKISTR